MAAAGAPVSRNRQVGAVGTIFVPDSRFRCFIGSEYSIILIRVPMDTHRDLILDAGDVEKWLDLLPQLPPGPGAELQVFAQVALDNLESHSRK